MHKNAVTPLSKPGKNVGELSRQGTFLREYVPVKWNERLPENNRAMHRTDHKKGVPAGLHQTVHSLRC